jgi:pimeloyl-ACP methyl ester carboxylesterase
MLRRLLASLLLLVGATAARADVAVLVHGYLGTPWSWDTSGVNAALASQGWRPAAAQTAGLVPVAATASTGKTLYTVALPSIAPLPVQAEVLGATLRGIESRHPGERITLVGHSAGGVVARLALVRGGAGKVTRLITIASPHLGTHRALQALDETHGWGPVGWIKDFFGGDLYHTVKASTPLLVELAPAVPGSLLGWLNAQPHPDIDYVSVIRTAPDGMPGDWVVPGFSQDMNQIPALRGQSRVVAAASDHALLPHDGLLLARLLAE